MLVKRRGYVAHSTTKNIIKFSNNSHTVKPGRE